MLLRLDLVLLLQQLESRSIEIARRAKNETRDPEREAKIGRWTGTSKIEKGVRLDGLVTGNEDVCKENDTDPRMLI